MSGGSIVATRQKDGTMKRTKTGRGKSSKIRITKKIIENLLLETVGERVIPVFNIVRDNPNISEFIVAEQLGLDIHEVRQLLYKLHDLDLVTYIRKKDRKKGWYISYWTFHIERVKDLILRLKKRRLDLLHRRLEKEESNHNFFLCKNGCIRLDFEKASEFLFKCPECGELLNPVDNQRTIANIKERIKELEREIKNFK
jgi:transcription initiation factor TFIIE subunit alpha